MAAPNIGKTGHKAAHRGVTDLEHGGPRAYQPHKAPSRVALRMYLLRTGGHITVTGSAKPLHSREIQANNRTMRHGAVHHGSAAVLVARQLILTLRTSRA
jgi:hypothetical protein